MPAEFQIEFRWKEQVYYWEGARGLLFDGGWGADPVVTYVPDEPTWARVAPDWARDRRVEIVQRLIDHGDTHRVVTTPDYGPLAVTRTVA